MNTADKWFLVVCLLVLVATALIIVTILTLIDPTADCVYGVASGTTCLCNVLTRGENCDIVADNVPFLMFTEPTLDNVLHVDTMLCTIIPYDSMSTDSWNMLNWLLQFNTDNALNVSTTLSGGTLETQSFQFLPDMRVELDITDVDTVTGIVTVFAIDKATNMYLAASGTDVVWRAASFKWYITHI